MNSASILTRRDFLNSTALAAAGAAISPSAALRAAENAAPRFSVIAFSKAFQGLSPQATADLVAAVGWDGIECPVRAGGHVLPERVGDDLPRMVAALQERAKTVTMITTDIKGVDAQAEKVLRTAARLGIKRYRLGSFRYGRDKSIPAQLAQFKAPLRDLAALNRELGIMGGYQNHSGADNVGAPVWDIYELIKDLDPKHLGICFDIGHATLEGGLSWPIEARLMEPFFAVIYVKDFAWQKSAKGWRAAWCPLGDGMVSRDFISWLKKTTYAGAISQHHEYPLSKDQDTMIAQFRKDLMLLREWLG